MLYSSEQLRLKTGEVDPEHAIWILIGALEHVPVMQQKIMRYLRKDIRGLTNRTSALGLEWDISTGVVTSRLEENGQVCVSIPVFLYLTGLRWQYGSFRVDYSHTGTPRAWATQMAIYESRQGKETKVWVRVG